MTGSARIRNGVFSLATVLTLGFGTVQAFAAPGAPQQKNEESCTGAQWSTCVNRCRSQGYMGGTCELYNGYPLCDCYGIIQPSAK